VRIKPTAEAEGIKIVLPTFKTEFPREHVSQMWATIVQEVEDTEVRKRYQTM
jgi:hypothetical protein